MRPTRRSRANNPGCGLIGVYDVGCEGPTPVRPVTWGRIKALYK
jgi:hypothetical protein